MIFVTVGSMLPFDRLVQSMDNWSKSNRDEKVVCQIGGGNYIPENMEWHRMLTSSKFMDLVSQCDLLVAHAGMGSVFSAIEYNKPVLLVPRYADTGEHTTDHQIHTADWLRKNKELIISYRDDDISAKISEAKNQERDKQIFSLSAPENFISFVRETIIS